MSDKYPRRIDEIKGRQCYVIVEGKSSTYLDPYEKAGSGITTTDHYLELTTFDNVEALQEEIKQRTNSQYTKLDLNKIAVFKLVPVEVQTQITIKVKEND